MRRHVTLLVLVVAAGTWAVAASAVVFPHLSVNSDEATYLLEADALTHGRLFPPAPRPADALTPWLSVRDGDHFVTKYAPVHPAVIALADALGWRRLALAAIAATAALSTFLLARRVLGAERHALVATGFLVASPLFLVQSATYLPYVSELALLASFAAAIVSAVDGRSDRRHVLAGMLLGVALFARPFDAVLVGAPFVAWAIATSAGRRVRAIVLLGAGLVPPVAVMLLYFRAATGNVLRPPFTLLDASDTVGFGDRRMFPFEEAIQYGPATGSRALLTHALLMLFWGFGGLLLVGLAAIGVARARRATAAVPLAAVAVTIPLGYLFFWGTANALAWGAPFHLGPYYWMPVLLPLAIFGARGFVLLGRWSRRGAFATLGVMALLAAVVSLVALRTGMQYSDSDEVVWDAYAAADLRDAVVFLPVRQLGHPFQQAQNDASYDGDVVWAIDRGPCRNAEVMRAYPARAAYRLRISGRYRSLPVDPALSVRFERVEPPCEAEGGSSSGSSPRRRTVAAKPACSSRRASSSTVTHAVAAVSQCSTAGGSNG